MRVESPRNPPAEEGREQEEGIGVEFLHGEDGTARLRVFGGAMGKKGVPEWLNSPLWSSGPSSAGAADDQRISGYALIPEAPVPLSPRPPHPRPSLPATAPAPRPTPPAEAPRREIGDDRSNPDPSPFSPEEASRQSQLLAEQLSKKVINLTELRRLATQGIPDGAGIRPTMWKLLLGYLPNDRGLWASELAKKRSQYKAFKDELLMNPSEITRRLYEPAVPKTEDERSDLFQRLEVTHREHPLSLRQTSVWNKFFQDSDIIAQIDRDVKRTHPDIPFFSGNSSFAKSNREALKRILIIFAKLNPGIRYVQGMNEVLAPLFYVFRSDPDEDNAVSAESDTFYCFTELLSQFRDNFCEELDNSIFGIRSTIIKLSQLLRKHDEELWRHLEVTTKINPQLYAFRWITLLLTQDFNFTDSLQIWDTLFSDPEGPQETLLRICCAMLILVRRRLLAGDFMSNLKLLQHYPPTNINQLLYVANKLRGTLTG